MARYQINYRTPGYGVPNEEVTASYWDLDQGNWFDFYAPGEPNDAGVVGADVIVMTVNAELVRSIVRLDESVAEAPAA